MADTKKDDPTRNADPATSAVPQKSIDPVYQAGRTVGGSDASPARGYTNVATDLRSSMPRSTPPRNIDYPTTLYHPVLGARQVKNSDEANKLPGPAHNWWPSPGEADMHRTDLEAQEAIHQARRWKNDVNVAMIEGGDLPVDKPETNKDGSVIVPDTGLPVRLSVQAEETLKRGGVEPH